MVIAELVRGIGNRFHEARSEMTRLMYEQEKARLEGVSSERKTQHDLTTRLLSGDVLPWEELPNGFNSLEIHDETREIQSMETVRLHKIATFVKDGKHVKFRLKSDGKQLMTLDRRFQGRPDLFLGICAATENGMAYLTWNSEKRCYEQQSDTGKPIITDEFVGKLDIDTNGQCHDAERAHLGLLITTEGLQRVGDHIVNGRLRIGPLGLNGSPTHARRLIFRFGQVGRKLQTEPQP